jgi:hypothetical protein
MKIYNDSIIYNTEKQLTPSWRVLLKKLTALHLVINSPYFTEPAYLILPDVVDDNYNNSNIQCYIITNSML